MYSLMRLRRRAGEARDGGDGAAAGRCQGPPGLNCYAPARPVVGLLSDLAPNEAGEEVVVVALGARRADTTGNAVLDVCGDEEDEERGERP